MAIAYPFDLLTEFPGWSSDFSLMYRIEQSRTAGGRSIVRELGPAMWRASFQSREMRPNELDYWRARLATLENGLQTFMGYHKARCYPIADPNGSLLVNDLVPSLILDFLNDFSYVASATAAQTIAEVGGDNKTLKIGGLPPAYVLSVGDHISYTIASGERFLRQVVAGGTADAGGVTPFIEVRPHLASGTLAGQTVTLIKPWVPMALIPGTVAASSGLNGRGRVTFEAMEAK